LNSGQLVWSRIFRASNATRNRVISNVHSETILVSEQPGTKRHRSIFRPFVSRKRPGEQYRYLDDAIAAGAGFVLLASRLGPEFKTLTQVGTFKVQHAASTVVGHSIQSEDRPKRTTREIYARPPGPIGASSVV
jgi:hypothetical protein